MPSSRYFMFGDLLSNALCGLVAALFCLWWIDSNWSMLPAMLVGMVLGMFAAMVLDFAVLMRYFGAMEVMLPTMLTGMLAGMWVGMRAAMAPLMLIDAIIYGVMCGLVVIALCWTANNQLGGKQLND